MKIPYDHLPVHGYEICRTLNLRDACVINHTPREELMAKLVNTYDEHDTFQVIFYGIFSKKTLAMNMSIFQDMKALGHGWENDILEKVLGETKLLKVWKQRYTSTVFSEKGSDKLYHLEGMGSKKECVFRRLEEKDCIKAKIVQGDRFEHYYPDKINLDNPDNYTSVRYVAHKIHCIELEKFLGTGT